MKKFNEKSSIVFKSFIETVIDEKKRDRVLAGAVYLTFAVVALIMSIINIITQRIPLLIATSVFSLLCAIDFIIEFFFKNKYRIAKVLFMIEMIALLSFFIITGGTDNFSIIWLLLLPTLGLFFFGIKDGSFASLIILIIMLLFFYIPPFCNYCTDYGDTFTLRFPIVYCLSYIVSIVLEMIRYYTAKELNELRKSYAYLYSHDALTGVDNRYSIYNIFAEDCNNSSGTVGVLIFDIDGFKKINDKYGHQFGDFVLKELCATVSGILPEGTDIFRWGGEEFVVITGNGEQIFDIAENINESIKNHVFNFNGNKVSITACIGAVKSAISKNAEITLDFLISLADNNLYAAKAEGRGCIKTLTID